MKRPINFGRISSWGHAAVESTFFAHFLNRSPAPALTTISSAVLTRMFDISIPMYYLYSLVLIRERSDSVNALGKPRPKDS